MVFKNNQIFNVLDHIVLPKPKYLKMKQIMT